MACAGRLLKMLEYDQFFVVACIGAENFKGKICWVAISSRADELDGREAAVAQLGDYGIFPVAIRDYVAEVYWVVAARDVLLDVFDMV